MFVASQHIQSADYVMQPCTIFRRGLLTLGKNASYYISDTLFGLAKSEAIMVTKRKQDWILPTNAAKRGNAAYIRHIVRKSADEAAANNRNNT
jgi:hypothetical protein